MFPKIILSYCFIVTNRTFELLCQVTFYISWRDDQIPLQEGSVLFTEGKTVSSKPCEFYQPGIGRCRVERDWKNATFKDRDEDIDNKCLTSDCKNCNFRGHIAKCQTSFFVIVVFDGIRTTCSFPGHTDNHRQEKFWRKSGWLTRGNGSDAAQGSYQTPWK